MDDAEYYSMMRRQYSNPVVLPKKSKKNISEKNSCAIQTPGTFSEWNKNYGHEDAEMFMERNKSEDDS